MNNVTQLPVDPPQKSTVEDRRIINEKLLNCYGDGSYTKGWDDEKVAKDLGVPRAWVSEVREYSFGPNVSEEDSVLARALDEALRRIREIMVQIDTAQRGATQRIEALVKEAGQIKADIDKMIGNIKR